MNGFGLFSNLVERVQSTIDANLGIDSEQAKEAMGKLLCANVMLGSARFILD